MFIEIDMDSEVPIYIQLMNGLIEAIANGSLQTGDTLPSVRSLASDLGINMHTVNKTYRELEKKGLVQIIPKSGTIVQQQTVDEAKLQQFALLIRPIMAELLANGLTEKQIQQLSSNMITSIEEGEQ
ncbi:GntR family transcriptional regulator [Sporosarcina pasteurii]|uniref:Transcriptional regulatory protein PtsJ n=1 Tax=Sporosarcina pasteurii TaxID=1474 RepID=A0A380C5K3_SPOPA|nr:GntR family transcriptional regulator [Sporosarcina pasteurii]MDS9471701.1 GntR family transcriptional regulator [Sporosarcina pasteurii]QBQ04698.1 GntR family transcriptional regulator [Sporosarcina pasteurii]SUJ12172.1 transcriptional regulatory protein PtsJ [Sporosarcina pasteurii]